LTEFAAYFRAAKARFVDACINGVEAYPDPVAHWPPSVHGGPSAMTCASRDDRLTLVYGLRTDQARELAETAGISTVAELAACTEDQVPGITPSTFHKLRRQARFRSRPALTRMHRRPTSSWR